MPPYCALAQSRIQPRSIKCSITAFARSGNGGLVVLSNPGSAVHRELIITLAARHKLPAV